MESSPFDLRTKLFKRCVDCADVLTAACPTCKPDQVCILTAQTCTQCPTYQCQKASDSGAVESKPSNHSSSPAPMIIGGVVGGIALIAITVFVVWKFVLKGRRREAVEDSNYDAMHDYPLEKPGSIPRGASRASTHTVASMASTVLTRASNVIQIAYIPGVTNRQQAGSPLAGTPNTLVPPVPPIPIPTTPNSNVSSPRDDQLLFLPGDLRDSTYSDLSELDPATLRKSISPSLARTSIASAVVHDASAAVMTAKPSIVSVSKSPLSPLSPATPPVPSLDLNKYAALTPSLTPSSSGPKPRVVQMPLARDGVSVPLTTATSMKPKALLITKKSTASDSGSSYSSSPAIGAGRIISIESRDARPAHSSVRRHDEDDAWSEGSESPHERSRQSLMRHETSPFADEAALARSGSTSTVGERKGKGVVRSGSGRSEGPFGDRHAL